MAQTGKVIAIPVQFKEAGNTMAQIMQTLQKAVREVDLESSLGKKVKSMMDSLQGQLDDYTQLILEPTIDQTSLRKAERMLQTFAQRAGKIDSAISSGSVFDFNLSKTEIDDISNLTTQVRELNAELAKLKKNGSSRATDSYLQEIGEGQLLDRARKTSKTFKSDASLGKNQAALEAETKQARDNIARLQAEQATLQQQADAIKAKLAQQQTALRNAQRARDKSKTVTDTGNFLTQFESFNYKSLHTESGQLRGQTAVLNKFMDALMKDSEGGRIAEHNRHGAEMVLKQLGMDPATIETVLSQQGPQIRAAIARALDITDTSNDMISQDTYDRLRRVQSSANSYMRRHATDARYAQYEQEQQAVRDAQSDLDRTQADFTKANKAVGAKAEEVRNLQAMATELESVTQALANFANALNQLEVTQLQGKIDNAEAALDQKKNEIKNSHTGKTNDLPAQRGDLSDLRKAGMDVANQEQAAIDETKQFTENLKQSVRHWMSAQQVVNLIKDGVRAALRDVQNLDKAMTNIAVVTDMSVGDLWGKINEYMSIAQQYGVSTQGVYEVSQLYYQQGLDTAEVMAATTETLKMARIAGMDYAEAADAMTVAIRAFKMEMTDAQHITDVYSKVAAVTASDTEELAIAMSKTASSAESVGSSFENTTAMLAVMIETTRESAQNLGSALKSIISRYGEMKVGLTVDSEGEEIDYNKVDTALKSVGISIKDAQGQFRDFDDVIFELSEKWDSLDKNTQRYIATIMAGNRQQSRFIALVDNWERLDEVTKAAADSQDAGLLQYSKTLDSLETKLTNIKTSFQQFYMSIINGPVVGFFLELGNSILQAFNKLGAIQSIFNVLTWVRTIKMIANLIFKGFEGPIAKIVTSYKQRLQEMTRLTGTEAFKAGQIYAQQFNNGMNSRPNGRVARRMQNGGYGNPSNGQGQNGLFSWGKHQKTGQLISIGGQLLGTALSSISTATANSNAAVSTWTGIGSNVASMASMGAVLGPWGAAAGALLGAVTSLHEVADIQEKQAQIDYENAQKVADDANIKRAETKNNSDSLKNLIDQYKQADTTKNDSKENYDNWLSINQQLADMYPALISYMDEEGNAIVNITEASLLLEDAFKKTTSATLEYYNAEIQKKRKENAAYGETNFEAPVTWTRLWDADADNKAFFVNLINNNGEMPDQWYEAGERAKGLVGANQNVSVADMVAVLGDLQEYVRYLQGVDSDKFFTSNGKTYIDNGRGMGYDAEYMSRMMIELGIIQYDELSGAYTLSDAVQKYDPNFETNPELLGMLQARSLAHLSNLSNESFHDDSLARITGFNGFLYNYLHEIQNISDDQIALLTEVDYNDYLQPISNFFSQLSTVNQALFENLISDYTNYSYSYVNDILTKLRVPDDIKQTILEGWTQNNSGWQSRLLNQGVIETGQSSSIGQILTYEAFNQNWEAGLFEGTFMANHENPATAYQAYLKWQALKLGEDYVLLIQNLTGQAAIDFSNWIKAEKEKQNASGKSGEIAGNRYNWIFETYANSYAEDGFLAELSSEAQQEFRTLLITDAGSSEWAQKIQDFVEKYDIDVEGIENIESYIFENLGIRATQFNDSVNSYIEKLDNLTKKQDKGYTSSEAQALAELRGLPLMDLFEVNEEGLLVLRDLRAEQARVLEEELAKNSRLKEKYTTARAFFQDNAIEGKSFTKQELVIGAIGADTFEETLGWLTGTFDDLGLNLDPELAEQLATEIHNGTITSYEQFIAYLDKQLELLQITEEQYNKATAALQNEQDRVKFSEKYQADISAVGLDKIFNGTLINAEGVFTASWGEVNEAGELLITDYEGLIAALTAVLGEGSELLDYWTKQINDYQIKKDQEKFNETYSVSVSATSLDTVFGGTLIDVDGVFSADWGSVDAAGNLLIDDYEALIEALAAQLGEESEAFRAWQKVIASYSADIEKDVNSSLVDALSKMQLADMYGLERVQLTNEEVKALYDSYVESVESPDDFDTWADYHGFWQTGTGYEFETAYANGEYNYRGYSWDQFFYSDDGWLGIAGPLDTATTTALYEAKADLLKTIEGLDLDSDYSSVKKFYDAGILTEEQYQAFFTSGQTAYEYLMNILSQSANEEVQAAVKKAKDAVTLEEAFKLDSSRLNLEDNFIDLFQNISETSLQDIQNIYEQIYGEESFTPEIAARYQTALAQAREGTVQPLINLLYELANMANSSDKGFEVDTAKLNSAYKDVNNVFISGLVQSLNSGLSGTLSNIDFDNLIEQIGEAPEKYRKYVTETFEGLKISAEGVLAIVADLVKEFGNADLITGSIVAQLIGSDTLGSYKDIEEYIEKVENGTISWGDETENVLNILYKMKNEYSQLAEDARFDFMNQDHFGGAVDNWYTFTDNMSTAIDKLKSAFEKGGKIDYKSFDNIVTWIADLSVDGLDTKLGETGITLGKFTDAVLATVDATGNLDLSAAAANLGISMDDMAGALEGGLQEVAKQQVAYWKKYLDFLKGLKKLQDAQAEVQLEIPIKNETTGKWTYKGNTYDSWEALAAVYEGDVAAAQQYFENFSYTGANGTTITLSGENNPLNFILGKIGAFDSEGNLDLKEGMAAQIGQYMAQVYAWIDTLTADDIKKYVNEDTGEITIPWDEVLQIELDTSTTPEVSTSGNSGETGAQTEDAINNAAEQALTDSGLTPAGDGSYTYTLDDMTLKIQMGANGSVEIDLTNATGTLPSAAELRKVFEGQEGFTATDDNNWVFTDPNLGFSVKCANGTLSFDTSGMTAPAAPTAAELSAILGTTWTTTDGGKTYTTNLNGVSFVYNSATGKININASSFQLTGGLDATSLATILGGTWTTEDNGATYTATIAGTSFIYESSSGLVKIDGSKFTLSGGLSATELATILGGAWSSPDGGITYESTINGVTFTYKSASGTVEIDSSTFTLSAGLSAEQLTALLGSTWSTEDGITYKSVISGVTFTYESTTGTINVDPSGFTVSANLTADQLKTLLGGTWTSKDGITYKSTINGATFTYESTTGKLFVTPPTTVTEPATTDFITLMQAQGWTHENGVYTKDFGGGTLTYNATAGALNITPSATMAAANPDMATLLDSAFGAGGWQPNENGGYDILNAETGEIIYTLPAKITITPTEGSNVGQGENGLTADVGVTLTPDTNAIDTALAAYDGKSINLTIGINKNSTLKSSSLFDDAAEALFGTSDWDTLLNTKNWSFLDGSNQDRAEEAFGSLVTQASVLSNANLLTQEDVDLLVALGEAMAEAGVNVSATMETLSSLTVVEDNTVLTDLVAFAEAFSGANLFGNLTALTALLTAMTNPAAVSLDLTGFITQLQSMGELELDDEEINNFVTAITALTTAITALPTEVNVSVKVSAGTSYSVISGIKRALDSIKNKTVTITTKHVNSGGDGGDDGDENPGTPTDADYAGNVSGLALAKGNATDKLLAGARLAGKTLVGELGPELAVYDNQYHLLGRNGAEFVDLPNDAIVFNHRQTAGIIKGQAGYRGQALMNGNVTGPAAADGIDAAISAVEKIIKLWSNIADSSLSDLLSGGSSGGGGSGNTIKAVTEELQEWYNLSRQIEHIEQEINNLIAERANLLESDGAAYLRSLREEQALLRDQVATQEVLLEYQQLQLKRQADQINQNDIWSKFLEVDENGLLQYKNGNEANGGKGALDVLQGLNEMSGEEQIEYLKKIGYSYTTADGEKLEGEDLVKQFFQEFQDQIDSYDSLYDTVHQTEEKLQQLATSIEEINNEIKENQMDLEQEIFDILVEAWEAEIEALEEQKELIEDANEAYINGLNEALQTEREMYSDNERLADREQLQRQLSLLRRSGGSASEIASLEEQLDSMLKEEYFSKQEQMIQNISDANDEQIRLLEEQITLEQESLEYQKENGILWSKVYEIMSGSTDSILAFMQGNSPSFFAQSALQQEQMLTEWAKKVGIYTENRKYEEHESYAKEQVWDTGAIWSQNGMSGLKSTYDALGAQGKETVRNQFASAYASARVNGADHDTALQQAAAAVKQTLEGQQGAQEDEQNQVPTNTPDVSGSETWYVAGPGKLNLRKEASTNSQRLGQYGPGTAMKVLKKDGEWFKVEVDGKTGWVMSQYLTKTKPGTGSETEQPNNSGSDLTHWTFTFNGTKYSHYKSKASAESKIQSLADGLDAKWAKNVEDGVMTRSEYARRKTGLSTLISNAKKTLASGKHSKGYSKGGLVDYTGLALVHGKPGQPEAFLNAKQTAMIAESVKSVGDGGALDGIRATLAALNSTIRSITNNNTTQTSSFTVAPGAVTIQVAQLNDSYDVEELSKDVMNRMVAIASKTTNRGVSRR